MTQVKSESASHTPGPWIVSGFAETSLRVYSDEKGRSAEICKVTPRWSTDEADARLIAAAPDLLEACKEAAKVLPYNTVEYVKLQCAITKATQ